MKISVIILVLIVSQNLNSIDFEDKYEVEKWFKVNDGVMGGISKSNLSISKNKGIFKGYISLENNGGFASIRRPIPTLRVNKNYKIKLTLYGDNKNYQIRIKDLKNRYYTYVQTIYVSDAWKTYELELKKFTPQFRGYKLDKSNFNKETIEEIGILIANKKEEKFELKIKSITITK